MKVIDISSYQENINWDQVIADGVQGVIMKVGEYTLDECFSDFLSKVKELGLPWGVYWLTHAESPDEASYEAQRLISALSGEIPPLGAFIDIEDNYVSQHGDTTQECVAFMNQLTPLGIHVGIYAGYYTLRDSIQTDTLADYVGYWLAQYGVSEPDWKRENPDKNVVGWQWSEHEYIGDTEVDMNEWYTEE